MPEITLEQALYYRPAGQLPRLHARSPGFMDAWLPDVMQLLVAFGDRPTGVPCPAAIFARPLSKDYIAVVQVADLPLHTPPLPAGEPRTSVRGSTGEGAGSAQPTLGFHVLVITKAAYRQCLGDPFAATDRFPPLFSTPLPAGEPRTSVRGSTGEGRVQAGGQVAPELPALTIPAQPLPPRPVADVQQVLKRVKAGAFREDEDPEAAGLTVENAESPALLGGVQILVDGGKLVFVRPAPDQGLIRGLWTLLPDRLRSELWPATFAFSNALGFDALVVPIVKAGTEDYGGYLTEEQAADYPAGRYELNLQTAAESGDQAALDALLGRRGSRETLRLAIAMVVVLSIALLLLRSWSPVPPPSLPLELSPVQRERAAMAAAMAANGDPWTAVALHEAGRYRQAERPAAAAAIVASQDPFAAAIQARAAYARYVEIWGPAK